MQSFQRDLPDATQAEAECVVDALLERFTIDEIEDELGAEVGSAEFGSATVAAMADCGYDLTTYDEWNLSLVGALSDLGYEVDDARCVADVLTPQLSGAEIEQLVAGELPPGFRGRLVDALEECGAG